MPERRTVLAAPVRLMPRYGRQIGRALVIVLALWLAWAIIGNTAADRLARSDPAAALAWRPHHAAALTALGERKLLAESRTLDAAKIAKLGRAALIHAPLDTGALRLLALAAKANGDTEGAEKLMEIADDRSRRDAFVQLWLFDRQTARADFTGALRHADAALRTWPVTRERLLPSLLTFADSLDARAALTATLSRNPPWRGWYLGEIARDDDHADAAFALLAALNRSENPPNDDELAPYLHRLIAEGRYEEAYLGWLHFLPAAHRKAIDYVDNGGFEYPVSGLPFDWSIGAVAGARTMIVRKPEAANGGYALGVQFANRRVAFRHVRKLLMLPPGVFRLAGEFRADALRNPRGLVWRLACAENEKDALAESPPVRGTLPWMDFEVRFMVPHENCRAQWLTLALAARTALEQRAGGTAWFDNVRVERISRSESVERVDSEQHGQHGG